MSVRFDKLSDSQTLVAIRLLSMDKRARALTIYELLARARVAVCTAVLKAIDANRTPAQKRGGTARADRIRQQRTQNVKRRLQKSIQFVRACENASRRVLVRRVRARVALLGDEVSGRPA